MPNVRQVQTNVGGVRTALALGSSSNPTALLTFAASLVGPDGVAGIGAIVDRITLLPTSSQAASRVVSLFLSSSSGPTLSPAYLIGKAIAPINAPSIELDGPYRGKSSYTVYGCIDSTALDVYAIVDGSEIY